MAEKTDTPAIYSEPPAGGVGREAQGVEGGVRARSAGRRARTDLCVLVLLLLCVDGGVGADDGPRVLHHVAVLVHQQLALNTSLDVLGGDDLHSPASDPFVWSESHSQSG